MTRIRLHSARWAAQATLTAQLASTLASCTFDVTPTAPTSEDRDTAAGRRSTSSARDAGSTSQQMRAATAVGRVESPTPTDGMVPDGAMSAPDAGRANAEPAGRDAGRPADNVAGSAAAPMEPTEAIDAAPPEAAKPDTSRCMPGSYEGTFEGPVTFAVGSINRVTGTVRAELVLEPSGESLIIRDGVITGMDGLGVGMSATWTGNVNCGVGQLENGTLQAGAWDNGSTFTGTLEGTYSPVPHSLSGTWQVQSVEFAFAGGNGDWRMALRGNSPP